MCYYTGNLVDGLFDGAVSAEIKAAGNTYTGSFTADNGAVEDVSGDYPQYEFGGNVGIVYVVLKTVACSGIGIAAAMMVIR